MFSYKDKFPLFCRSMVVYYKQCKQCGPSAAYIGKTVNTVYERFFASGTGLLCGADVMVSIVLNLVVKFKYLDLFQKVQASEFTP